jgi:hypothetical protein
VTLFRQHGLEVQAVTGVDPAPFRPLLLPYVRRLPPALSRALLWLSTALCLPINMLLGRRAVNRSWHAVFVLERKSLGRAYGH